MIAEAHEEEDGKADGGRDECFGDSGFLLRRELERFLIKLILGKICACKARCHEAFGDKGAYERKRDAGCHEEIVVDRRRSGVVRIDHTSCRFGEAIGQRVRHADHHIRTEAGCDARKGAEYTEERVTPHAEEDDTGHRRQDDECRIACDIAIDADENDRKGDDRRRRASQDLLHEGRKEAALFCDARADDANEYHAERSKAREVADGFRPDHAKTVDAQKIHDFDDFVCARMHCFGPHRGKDGRQHEYDSGQQDKERGRIRQLVPRHFDGVQEPVHQGFLLGFFHK